MDYSNTCLHDIVVCDVCAHCGTPLASSTVDYRLNSVDLLRERKLALLIDVSMSISLADIRTGQESRTFQTEMRPLLRESLEKLSLIFQIYTITDRQNAKRMRHLIDPLFGGRVISYDELLNLCGHKMVVILDDRTQGLYRAANVVRVRPFVFFEGDVNRQVAPDEAEYIVGLEGVLKKIHHSYYTEVDRLPEAHENIVRGGTLPDVTAMIYAWRAKTMRGSRVADNARDLCADSGSSFKRLRRDPDTADYFASSFSPDDDDDDDGDDDDDDPPANAQDSLLRDPLTSVERLKPPNPVEERQEAIIYSDAQNAILESRFSKKPYTSFKDRVEIKKMTGISKKRIGEWFRRRRTKYNKEHGFLPKRRAAILEGDSRKRKATESQTSTTESGRRRHQQQQPAPALSLVSRDSTGAPHNTECLGAFSRTPADVNPFTVLRDRPRTNKSGAEPSRPPVSQQSGATAAPSFYTVLPFLRRDPRRADVLQCRIHRQGLGLQEADTLAIDVPRTIGDCGLLMTIAQPPTPLQRLAWGILRRFRDLLCVAKSDVARTLTFVIHAMAVIKRRRKVKSVYQGPTVIVLTADEASATEVDRVVQRYISDSSCQPDRRPMIHQLIENHIKNKHLPLGDVELLVVDGLDSMVPEVRADVAKIIRRIGPSQWVITSLTREASVCEFALEQLVDPVLLDESDINIAEVPMTPVDVVTESLSGIHVKEEGDAVKTKKKRGAQQPKTENVLGGRFNDTL